MFWPIYIGKNIDKIKFIYSEKSTKCCEISTVDLTVTIYTGQINGGDFTKFCGLLRIYELYSFKVFGVNFQMRS